MNSTRFLQRKAQQRMAQADRGTEVARPDPQIRSMLWLPRSISNRSCRGREAEEWPMRPVWLAIKCLHSRRRTISGCRRALTHTKKVPSRLFHAADRAVGAYPRVAHRRRSGPRSRRVRLASGSRPATDCADETASRASPQYPAHKEPSPAEARERKRIKQRQRGVGRTKQQQK